MYCDNILRVPDRIACWTCTLRYVRNNFLELENGQQVDEICNRLLCCLIKQNCSDFHIILKVMAVCNRWLRRRKSLLNSHVKDNSLRKIFLPFDEDMSIISICKSELNYNGVEISLINANVKFTFAAVRYGFFVGEAIHDAVDFLLISHFLHCVQEDFLHQEIDNWLYQENSCKSYLYNTENRLYHCIPLLAKTLHAVTLMIQNCHFLSDYLECLELFFRAIPNPFIRLNEVREFLSFLFAILNIAPEVVESIVDMYAMLFPKDAILYGPRSLKHSCRCVIRRILIKKSGCLPKVVSSLEIPMRLHDYLICAE